MLNQYAVIFSVEHKIVLEQFIVTMNCKAPDKPENNITKISMKIVYDLCAALKVL